MTDIGSIDVSAAAAQIEAMAQLAPAEFEPEPIVRNRNLYPEIPVGWQGVSFDSLTVDVDNRKVIETLQAWAEVPGGSLVIEGATGVGKTQIISAVTNELNEGGADVSAWTWGAWCDVLRNVYRQDADDEAVAAFYARMRRCTVLVIDDMTAEQTSRQVLSAFENVIDSRWSARLATLITTNASAEQWQDWSARATSRLRDVNVGMWLSLKGPDRRRVAA